MAETLPQPPERQIEDTQTRARDRTAGKTFGAWHAPVLSIFDAGGAASVGPSGGDGTSNPSSMNS